MSERFQRILQRVQKPGRYVGGEWNAITKEWSSVEGHAALCYADAYEAGMSSPLLRLLYDAINREARFLAQRAFVPWPDMAGELRQEKLPLATLDAYHPVADFDVVCLVLEHEPSYPHALELLNLAGIPIESNARGNAHPLVVACGSATTNPEPMAAFVDLFVLGEPEEAILDILDTVAGLKQKACDRPTLIAAAAALPGIYAPSLCEVSYDPAGIIKAVTCGTPTGRATVRRRIAANLGPPITRPVVPYVEIERDMAILEVQRGCGPGCPECETGMPCPRVRVRPPEEILQAIEGLVRNCGYQDLLLLASGAVDTAWAEGLARNIRSRYTAEDLAVDFPSLPIDPRSVGILDMLAGQRKKRGYPLKIAAATERLRHQVHRPVADEVLHSVLVAAFKRQWEGIRFELSIGLPEETMEDVRAIIDMVAWTQDAGQRILGRRPRIRMAVSVFIPRPHTFAESYGLDQQEDLTAKLDLLMRGLKKVGAYAILPDGEACLAEACLARGDRKVGHAIHRAWQLAPGLHRATPSEAGNLIWRQAFQESGIDPAFYAYRPRAAGELPPWHHLGFREIPDEGSLPGKVPAAHV